jgi:hypothetical protein
MQTALSDLHYKLRFSPRCTELFKDFRRERLNDRGEIDEKLNVGVDDCRKALTYYLAWKRGTGLKKYQARPAHTAKGLMLDAPTLVEKRPRSWL